MARRRNSISKRFAKMRGLPPEEKALMQRIANLMDAALNNRQASNPFEPSKNRHHRAVYPPTNLQVKIGNRAAKITWDAPPSNQHLRYEILIRNTETGAEETKSSFTNELRYIGSPGSYEAKIKSVGRDGSSSEIQTISFDLGITIMQIEGGRNGPTTVGTRVQDSITMIEHHHIFVWGSVVLDRYMAGSSNNEIVFRLYKKEGENATFDGSAELVETIRLYPGTESGANLDDIARAGLITRPVEGRAGSFETSQSVMFSPISVAEDEEGKVFTFFLEEVNRSVEDDQVGLSIVLWGGAAGFGDSVPGDPFTPDPDYVFPHQNHFNIRIADWSGSGGSLVAFDTRHACAASFPEYNLIGNQWTLAMWVRFEERGNVPLAVDPYTGTITLFERQRMHSGTANPFNNRIRITYTTGTSGVNNLGILNVSVWGADDTAGSSPIEFEERSILTSTTTGHSQMLPWSNTQAIQNRGWYFIVVCFEGGPATSAGNVPKVRLHINNNRGIDIIDPWAGSGEPETDDFHIRGMCNQFARIDEGSLVNTTSISGASLTTLWNEIEQTDEYRMLYSFGGTTTGDLVQSAAGTHLGNYSGDSSLRDGAGGIRIHQAGMWNVALDNWSGYEYNPGYATQVPFFDSPPLTWLYNRGYGTEIDWRENSGEQTDPDVQLSYVDDSVVPPVTVVRTGNSTNRAPTEVYKPYIQAENLVHFWQFGAVEQAMSSGHTLRDTGFHLYKGDLNFTGVIDPHNPAVEAADTSHDPSDTDTHNGWTEETTIADIVSPHGENGTTLSTTIAYPGQTLTDPS